MNLSKRLYITSLYEIYNELLTLKQRQIFELYYEDDYSINEICEVLQITKNGVYNSLKQTENKLISFEQKLMIKQKYEQNIKLLSDEQIDIRIINKIL